MEWKIESRWLVPALFLLFLAAYGVFFYITNPVNKPADSLMEAIADGCMLEYGKSECIDGKLSIPFYNGSTKTVSYAEITIPTNRGIDIAGNSQQLPPGQSATTQVTACNLVDNSRPLKVKWCCEKCYETEMNNPAEAIKLQTS